MAYSYSDITFLENPFSFSVTLKTSLEPLRTIFPSCPLGLHLCSGQCPFNQEKCLRRCGIEDRNGSLTLTPIRHSPPLPSRSSSSFRRPFSAFVRREGLIVLWGVIGVVYGLGLAFMANRPFLPFLLPLSSLITTISNPS